MQKILIVLSVLYGGFCGISYATTVNYNWLVDGTNYAQTTCETGDDLILPTPSPTKYGYHFVGWVESEISGSWSQSGIPTPQNPIEPVFKPFLNTVLRAVGSGDNFISDSYDPETRTITRRIGVKVLDGTENWNIIFNAYTDGTHRIYTNDFGYNLNGISTHFVDAPLADRDNPTGQQGKMYHSGVSLHLRATQITSLEVAKQWLADQYNAGTPVTVYYTLATPTEESIQ